MRLLRQSVQKTTHVRSGWLTTNPIPILIPCHHVIGRNGKLTGYRGGLAVMQKLLELEGVLR